MASNQAPVVDRIRIIPRGQAFLDRNVGSSGEVFYNRDTNSLRLYNGNDRSGFEVSLLSATGTLDLTTAKNKIRAEWDTLANLTSEVDATAYQGMVAYVQETGLLYYANAAVWNPVGTGGGASVDVSTTPPVSPESGNIWFNSNSGRMYVYIDDGDTSQWVQPASPSQEVNAFSSIKLSDSMQMDAQGNDVLTFVDGPGITITNDSTNNTVIISASADAYDQSLNTTDDVVFESVSASSYINSGVGAPQITSASTITFNAPDGVIINNGPFRLPSFTTTQKNDIVAVNGDMVYDSTLNKAQVYEAGAWASLV